MRRIVKYEPNQTLRYCDECGARYLSSELVQGSDLRFRCRRFCLERTLIDVDRAAASVHRQREAPPPPFGQAYGMNQSWMNEEDIFSMVVNLAPWPGSSLAMNNEATPGWTAGFADRTVAIGESMIYLYNIIAQGKRPASWLSQARAKILSLADLLVAAQAVPRTTFLNGAYTNGLTGNLFAYIFNEARAALGLLRAWQLTGKAEYLACVKTSATWLTNMQRQDLWPSVYTLDYNTANRRFYGAFPTVVFTSSTGVFAHSTMAAVELFSAMISVLGDAPYGDTQGGTFISSASALLSTSIASALAFWSTPQYDYAALTAIAGFSATTPYDFWLPSTQLNNLQNTWQLQIAGQRNMFDVCWSLRSLYASQGASALFTSVYNWTMALAQNPATPTPTDPPYLPTVANSTAGPFSPKTGIATRVTSTAPFMNANQFISPSFFGCLAPNLDGPTLDYGKQAWGTQTLRNLSDASQGLGIPAMYTFLGLSNQMASAFASTTLSVVDAAIFGNVYRYQQSYTGI